VSQDDDGPAVEPGGARGEIKVFLIADIRGYTLFTQEQGDDAAARLAKAFAAVVEDVVGSHGGTVVQFRGDEALVVFGSPREAILSAIDLQSRFVDVALGEPELPLLVGIGVDAGEAAAVWDGYRGGSLNLAARLCSLAGPGEILSSPEVVHFARAIDGVRYVERGEARLKGLPDPVTVIKVIPDDDPAERLIRMKAIPAPAMRVMLADDSILLREGVARLLSDAGFAVMSQHGNADDLLDAVRSDPPDVAIVDIRMPPTHTDEGLRAAHQIRVERPKVGVLVLSQYVETDYAMELVSEGAAGLGYLLKDRVSNVQEFTDAVRRVAAGGSVIDPDVVSRLVGRARRASPIDALSERERDVLSFMAEGRSNQAISERMYVSPKTVEGHVRNIFTKLGLTDTPDDHRRVLAVLTFLRS
jgi:DNA-binding NarL/FixJ family response regulator/class 3 adenylate cyclase